MKVAQRFNAGERSASPRVPEGRLNLRALLTIDGCDAQWSCRLDARLPVTKAAGS
jgi:hypothetical protein